MLVAQHDRRPRKRRPGPVALALSLVAVAATAAEDPSPTARVPSRCPTLDAVWQELAALLPSQELEARLHSADRGGPAIRIEDLGPAFRITVLETTRQYPEETRDCRARARTSALFAALLLEPTALGEASPPAPVPAPPQLRPPTLAAPPASAPPPALWHIELGPAVLVALDGQESVANWGAGFRLSVGRGVIAPVLGVGGFLPGDTSSAGVRLRQWRLPLDLGLRATLSGGRVDWFGEAGPSVALLRERAPELLAARTATGVELGVRAGLGARLHRTRGLAPFVLLQFEVVPDPPSDVALPAGSLGQTPHVWTGACVGADWGLR